MPSPSVLIVGAGPVGLTTALALHQAGLAASELLVVDQRPSREISTIQSKALAVSASTLEVFRNLGIAERFLDVGLPFHTIHFGGATRALDLNFEVLGTRYPFNMIIPQARSEGILLRRCEEVGIPFVWGRQLTELVQTGDEVSATFKVQGGTETQVIRAPWLVGCDGTGSAVRQAAGIAFEGTRATRHNWLADGHMDEDSPTMWNIPGAGIAMIMANGDGKTGRRLIGTFPQPSSSGLAPGQRPVAPDLEDLRDWAVRRFGSHYNLRDLSWSSVVGDGMRIAANYRAGRVSVAGDAAHQLYPAGGQGMNTGLLDAVNLAWKLAFVATGKSGTDREAAGRVLDSYSEERRAAANAVRHNVHVQLNILYASTEKEMAAVDFMEEALGEPSINQRWARRVCGFADPVEPYQLSYVGLDGGDEKLIGTRLTHLSDASSDEVLEAAQRNRFVVGFLEGSDFADELRRSLEQAVRSSGRTEQISILGKPLEAKDPRWDGFAAVLIRPDLRVAWVGRDGANVTAAQQDFSKVVKWWLGGI